MSAQFVPWNSIAKSLVDYGNGQVTQSPSLDDMRQHVEARWRESRHS